MDYYHQRGQKNLNIPEKERIYVHVRLPCVVESRWWLQWEKHVRWYGRASGRRVGGRRQDARLDERERRFGGMPRGRESDWEKGDFVDEAEEEGKRKKEEEGRKRRKSRRGREKGKINDEARGAKTVEKRKIMRTFLYIRVWERTYGVSWKERERKEERRKNESRARSLAG